MSTSNKEQKYKGFTFIYDEESKRINCINDSNGYKWFHAVSDGSDEGVVSAMTFLKESVDLLFENKSKNASLIRFEGSLTQSEWESILGI